jgi:hypothetical protein
MTTSSTSQPAYPQYPDPVSIDQIEQAFLADREMYLMARVADILHLEIHHSDREDADDDECELFLYIGSQEDYEDWEFLTLTDVHHHTNGDVYVGCGIEDVIRHFKIDRDKAMWDVSKESRLLTVEEMRGMGHTEEQIQQVLKNREQMDRDA